MSRQIEVVALPGTGLVRLVVGDAHHDFGPDARRALIAWLTEGLR